MKRKTLKVKVPKRVAGVKIPKVMRKGPVIDFLNSSGGQVLIAEALLLTAGAYSARHADPNSAGGELIQDQVRKVKHTALSGKVAGKRATRTASAAAERLSYAFSEALGAFREALNGPLPAHDPLDDQTDQQAAETVNDVVEATGSEPQKKTKSRRSRLPQETIAALP